MDLKTVLFAALLLVAISSVRSVPLPEEEFPVIEALELPPDFMHIRTLCLDDDPNCTKEEDEKEKEAEKEYYGELKAWMERMGPQTKAGWKGYYPDTAKEYDELSKKY